MTPKEQAVERARLAGAVHAASDAVYRLTGRTDQSLNEIIALYPDYPAVKSLLAARKAVEDFESQALVDAMGHLSKLRDRNGQP